MPVEQGHVLFLALEGSTKGLKRRIEKMLDGDPAPENLHFLRNFPKLDEKGLKKLRAVLEDYPDTVLVVIDTLVRVRKQDNSRRSIYDIDSETLHPITQLGEELNVSILIIHHANKRSKNEGDVLDLVSGSTGLTGAVDNVLLMEKEYGQMDAKLTVIPREEEEAELALKFDAESNTWTLEGNADQYGKTKERQAILDVLKDAQNPLGPTDIANLIRKTNGSVRYLLSKMLADGKVTQPAYGKYQLAGNPNGKKFQVSMSFEGEKPISNLNTITPNSPHNANNAPAEDK